MMEEFAHKKHTCQFYMSQITKRDHTCAVLDLNEKEQKVYWFKAPSTGAPCTVRQPKTLLPPHKNQTPEASGGNVGGDPSPEPNKKAGSSSCFVLLVLKWWHLNKIALLRSLRMRCVGTDQCWKFFFILKLNWDENLADISSYRPIRCRNCRCVWQEHCGRFQTLDIFVPYM